MTQPNPKILLSVDEAAEVLGIARSTVYELLARGTIASRYIGRRRLIHAADLEDYAERLPTEAAS